MHTNKMREQFEAWYLEKHCGGIDRVNTCSNAPETYYYTETQTKWVAWQASRKAAVVDLSMLEHQHEEGPLYYRVDDVHAAIEAQGLKVAP